MDLQANKMQFFQTYYFTLKLFFYVIVFVWKANRGPNNSV